MHTRKSHRLKGWNYASDGAYFITIVTKNRIHLFGEVDQTEVILNQFGELFLEEWNRSFEMRKELSCDEFIIMPNHLHAIVIIENNEPIPNANIDLPILYRSPRSISSFIAGLKSIVTKRINEIRNTPGQPVWISRYHDYIIRDEKAYRNIKRYIQENPIRYSERKKQIGK